MRANGRRMPHRMSPGYLKDVAGLGKKRVLFVEN